jgi:hypothetical protein
MSLSQRSSAFAIVVAVVAAATTETNNTGGWHNRLYNCLEGSASEDLPVRTRASTVCSFLCDEFPSF